MWTTAEKKDSEIATPSPVLRMLAQRLSVEEFRGPGDALVPMGVVAELLKIGRNSVGRLGLRFWVIKNRKYFNKADILDWMKREKAKPTSILTELQKAHRTQMRRRTPSAFIAKEERLFGEMRSSWDGTTDDDEPSAIARQMRAWFDLLVRKETPSTEVIAGVTQIIEAAERLEMDEGDWCQVWDMEIDAVEQNGGKGYLPDAGPKTLLGRYQRARRAYFPDG